MIFSVAEETARIEMEGVAHNEKVFLILQLEATVWQNCTMRNKKGKTRIATAK